MDRATPISHDKMRIDTINEVLGWQPSANDRQNVNDMMQINIQKIISIYTNNFKEADLNLLMSKLGNTSEPPMQGHHIKEPPMPGHHIKEPQMPDHHIEEPLRLDHHINETPMLGHHIKQVPMPGRYMKEPPMQDQHIKEPPMAGHNIKEPSMLGYHIKESSTIKQRTADCVPFSPVLHHPPK